MRHLIFIIPILFFSSCNLDSKSGDKKSAASDSLQFELTDSIKDKSKSIIGEWGIYVTISNGMQTNCNVCPKIQFLQDETATLTLPSGDISKLKWKTEGNKLTLAYVKIGDDRRTFSDSIYFMTFKKEKEFTELELKQTDENFSKILRR